MRNTTLALFFSFLFFINNITAQENTTNQEKIIEKVELFILEKKLDSANFYIKSAKKDSYTEILQNIIDEKNLSYKDYLDFIFKSGSKSSVDYNKVSEFINTVIKTPKSSKINKDYVEIKWVQISEVRNNGDLTSSSLMQTELEEYVNKFNDKDIDVLKLKTKITTHHIVMYLIEKDIEKGKALVLKGLETAKKIDDKELQITFLYHLSDFLILERKLQEYIDVSEESLRLEKELPKKSHFYYSTIEHLIDAYVFKGDSNDKVMLLIDELYNYPLRRVYSYSLYVELISHLDKSSPLKFEILEKFKVKDVSELILKLEDLSKDLNSNNKLSFIQAAARAFYTHGYTDLAMSYKDKAIETTQKIYSQDLSQSLADYKTEQALKGKQKEIEHEKEKTTLYGIIALLAFVLFFIALIVLRKINKQSKELSEKNSLIREALKEKELLIKEVHHRVKNNFQIVSSLLELQSKGIEDEKALELANEGKNRVKSMALIHQKLYQNETGLVDFDEYIHLLVKELSALFKSDNKIDTSIKSENMNFDVDTAIPLGLIINEIITNSYKYAFTKGKENTLSISINKENDDNFKLIIEDNGPGLSDDIDIKKTKSLGLRLITRLVKQLHGKLKLTNDNGARFEILFKDIHARGLVD
ncbi:sensor histidine kinase [Polaribacter sargassicola]|uniref:sensor histidine kinase n=1 Tax=Polaribacter sargassicola TaxID=2836891 RepID=UPI001F37C0C2|nr:sensor histidine kinase [Polaribacter sp. DS7-9]MCG1034877.1 sensor histidine kinase [Polaribacter sp. DS7-9]